MTTTTTTTIARITGKKDAAAKSLAQSYAALEGTVTQVNRIISMKNEKSESEPIKLLLVNESTIESGILPVSFGPDKDVPYSTILVDVTPREFKRITAKKLRLPDDWKLGKVLFSK